MEMCHFLRVIKVRWTSTKNQRMSSLHQWIIVIQIVLNSSVGLSGGDSSEHVHIKVHVPDVHRKHTHFRKIQKHHFHPKKVVKTSDFTDADLETQSLSMLSFGLTDNLQIPSYASLPSFPDIPNYGVDNTLEATILKKPKKNSVPKLMSDAMLVKFHGMKKPSEFMGARPVAEMHRLSHPMVEVDDEEDFIDDYESKSAESVVLDQREAGTSYPSYKSKWPSYTSMFESSVKPYGSDMKWTGSLPANWMSATTEDDYAGYERFPSPTTMHIARARPLSSSRLKFEGQLFERSPHSEAWAMPKKKKLKTEKRNRKPSSEFRINY